MLLRSHNNIDFPSIYSFISQLLSMEPDIPNNKPPRKMKFAPKAPRPRRVVPKTEVKTEVVEEAVDAKELLRRFNESSARGRPKFERKETPVEVAFGSGGASTKIRSFGVPKRGASNVKNEGGDHVHSQEKEYKEPWDYYSYYPTSLPLRRPYSGNPELLNEVEFGDSKPRTYDENATNSAIDLGFMEENTEPQLLLVQLPPRVPMTKRSATADGDDADKSSRPPALAGTKEKTCSLDDLPAGFMGKLLVYKSGAIKLRLGDTLYDVSSGMNCSFAQNLTVINTTDKHCCNLGEINKRAVVTPDIESVLDGVANL